MVGQRLATLEKPKYVESIDKIGLMRHSEWITWPGFEKGGFGFAFQENPGTRVGFAFSKNV